MASSATLAAFLFAVLFGQQFVSGTGNANEGASICEPRPSGSTLGERSTCPFTVTEDKVFKRVPATIYHFSCNCPTNRCSDRDDYRCVQVRKALEVSVERFSTVKTVVQKKVVQVNASCVCATSKTGVPVPLADRPLDENKDKKAPQDVEGITHIHVNDTVDEFDELYF
ncbi:hypothetical protein HPB52_004038 [Rhipicephalus sanguineus]|uniref:Uncharacterized protein n=1 Tax=Rhipicephalus sanguineus TaxID=34632 RepID=A0A9D4QF88_RHISA|nr:hypothetical protein HPB52_004038 [Rhipicephalus sanguineus]